MGPWDDPPVIVRATPSLRQIRIVANDPVRITPALTLAILRGIPTNIRAAGTLKLTTKFLLDQARVTPSIKSLDIIMGTSARANPKFQITAQLVPTNKDSWFGTSSACNLDNANHNGDFMRLSLTTFRSAICAFDLSGFESASPSGLWVVDDSVPSASVRCTTQNAQTLGTDTVTAATIASADEGWSEAGVICSNAPASNSAFTTTNLPSAANTNATWISGLGSVLQTRLQAALRNRTTLSIRFDPTLGQFADVERVLFDKENGSTSQQPLLTFSAYKTF